MHRLRSCLHIISSEGKKYKQVFKDNMKTVGKPNIKEG